MAKKRWETSPAEPPREAPVPVAPVVQPVSTPAASVTPSVPPAKKSVQYRVTATKKASFYGQLVTLRKGTVINESGYGEEGIRRLRAAGVDLEEIK